MTATYWPLWAAAVSLLLIALGGLLWPLLSEPSRLARDDLHQLRALYRSKRDDLMLDAMPPGERQQVLDELQLGLLQEIDRVEPTSLLRSAWLTRVPAALLSVVLPMAALTLYLHVGDPRAVNELAIDSTGAHGGAHNQVDAAVERLAERLRVDPDDVQGWLILARSQETMERFADAAESYRQAIANATEQHAPDELLARLHADLADALASAHQGDFGGPAKMAIDAALNLDANQPKALALAGAAALRDGDTDGARRSWQRLLAILPAGSELSLRVESDLQRLSVATAHGAAGVKAHVSIDAALADRIPPQATVFVIVRPIGERMPAAVLRMRAADLPAQVVIDDRHAMSPERPLSKLDAFTIQARVSTSGLAKEQPEDWISETMSARKGQGQSKLKISSLVGPGANRP